MEGSIILEKTEKYFFSDEIKAEEAILQQKENSDGDLIDYKLSKKETKDGEYFIVVLKTRYATLTEAKEQAYV